MSVRKLLSVVVGAGLLVTLAACSSAPAGFAGCDSRGNASLVSASGAFASDPKAEFPTPLVAKSNDVHVISRGDGDVVRADQGADLTVSLYDGQTGDPIATQGGPLVDAGLRVFIEGSFPYTTALECATVGSRVVTTGTVKGILGTIGDNIGLDPASTIVVVTDVEKTFLGKANGADQVPQSGFPAVVIAPNGRAGITFPSGDVPTELKYAATKQGTGTTVKEGDSIIVGITGVVWGSAEPFASSWENDAPGTITVATTDGNNNGVAAGLAEALAGQRVGSQVIAIVPPELGYPEGLAPADVPPGSTLFFVVDILGIA